MLSQPRCSNPSCANANAYTGGIFPVGCQENIVNCINNVVVNQSGGVINKLSIEQSQACSQEINDNTTTPPSSGSNPSSSDSNPPSSGSNEPSSSQSSSESQSSSDTTEYILFGCAGAVVVVIVFGIVYFFAKAQTIV